MSRNINICLKCEKYKQINDSLNCQHSIIIFETYECAFDRHASGDIGDFIEKEVPSKCIYILEQTVMNKGKK